jgi:Xaa-Pro aminopeptidase
MTTYLERRRARVAAAWNLTDEIVLVGAGHEISIPGGADQTYPYIAHSDYYYLTDREIPGGVVAYDPKEGWVDFVPDVTTAQRVWEGKTETPGTPMSKFEDWLASRKFRRVTALGCPIDSKSVPPDEARSAELGQVLLHARRPKDEAELERMRAAAAATVPGYEAARRMIHAGVTERQIQVELETGFFRYGGTATAYGTIVASGANSAILHWPAASRVVEEGDVVLIDAGAAVGRYVADVTRTYRAPGGDDTMFRDLYSLVLAVEQRAITRCTAGREWQEIHFEAALGIVAGLVALGFMKGSPQTLVETDAHALFFPHGLGHMVGLGVRDAGGRAPGRQQSQRAGLKNLRVDLPLEVGYAMTVEPGLYFIPALINNRENREKYRSAIDWERVEAMLPFGGIRIEDNVVITEGAPEVLTAAIPKALD